MLALEHRFGRRVLGVNGHVLLHGRFLEEGLLAHRALVNGARMFQQLVLLQFVDVGAPGVAVRARKRRFFAGVRAPVAITSSAFTFSIRVVWN